MSQPEKQKRSYLRFGLRTFFAVLTLAALGLAMFIGHLRSKQRAHDRFVELGFLVPYEEELMDLLGSESEALFGLGNLESIEEEEGSLTLWERLCKRIDVLPDLDERFAASTESWQVPDLTRADVRLIKTYLPNLVVLRINRLEGDLTYFETFKDLQHLQIAETEADSLEPLRNALKLEHLAIGKSEIKSLEPIRKLTKLKTLDLPQSEIDSLEPISDCTDLRRIELGNTKASAVKALSKMKLLNELNLANTNAESVVGLREMLELRFLNISGTKVQSLVGIPNRPFMTLNIAGLNVTDFSTLQNRSFNQLDLFGTNLENFKPFADQMSVVTLRVGGPDLKSLDGIEKLCANWKKINLARLTDEQKKQIKLMGKLPYSHSMVARDGSRLNSHSNPFGETVVRVKADFDRVLDGVPEWLQPYHTGPYRRPGFGLQHLRIEQSNISSLQPLAILKNLSRVEIHGAKVKSLEPLIGHRMLKTIDISDCPIESIECLAKSYAPMHRINLRNTKITSLKGLERSTRKLFWFSVADSPVNDISVFNVGFEQLAELDLSRTKITDFRPLMNVQSMHKLNLTGTQFDDLSILSDRFYFDLLNISETKVTDLTPISKIKITELIASNTRIQDIPKFPRSIGLALDGTAIKNLDFVNNSNGIAWLDIANTNISDLTPLAGKEGFAELDISQTKVTDISPLLECKDLVRLTIEGLDITKKQLDTFKKARPKCKVIEKRPATREFRLWPLQWRGVVG